MRVLDIDEFPAIRQPYETIGGFMMLMLRKIPKRTDSREVFLRLNLKWWISTTTVSISCW